MVGGFLCSYEQVREASVSSVGIFREVISLLYIISCRAGLSARYYFLGEVCWCACGVYEF